MFRTRTPMSLAVCCLAAFMGLQAFCYAGFHAYVQVSYILLAHCINTVYRQANDGSACLQPEGHGPYLLNLMPLGSSDRAVGLEHLK